MFSTKVEPQPTRPPGFTIKRIIVVTKEQGDVEVNWLPQHVPFGQQIIITLDKKEDGE